MPGLVVNHSERGCVCTRSAAFLSSTRWEKEQRGKKEGATRSNRSVCVRFALRIFESGLTTFVTRRFAARIAATVTTQNSSKHLVSSPIAFPLIFCPRNFYALLPSGIRLVKLSRRSFSPIPVAQDLHLRDAERRVSMRDLSSRLMREYSDVLIEAGLTRK